MNLNKKNPITPAYYAQRPEIPVKAQKSKLQGATLLTWSLFV